MQINGHTKNDKWTKWVALFSLTTLIVLSGCSKNEEIRPENTNIPTATTEATNPPSTDGEKDTQKELLIQFKAVLESADGAADIIGFLNEHINEADQATSDIMLRDLNTYYTESMETAQEAFFKPDIQAVLLKEVWPITKETAVTIKDDAVKKLVQTAFDSGYKLDAVEGSIFPVVDYSYQKRYKASLTKEMNDYITLSAVESDKPTASDGGLMITWDELAKRAIMAEAFVQQYKDSPEREVVQSLYLTRYLEMYINGSYNTLVYDYETYKILDEVKASYDKTVKESPDSVVGQLSAHFLELLALSDDQLYMYEDGQKTDIPELQKFLAGLSEEAEALLNKP